ncbi:MAG TPA: GAF domain-containing protein, partial [Aggregatilineales bacterium]|nr:GAF domain-containing protein [Aggregatilineales bacterium]
MTNLKRPNVGIDLRRRWRALPIRSKLLLPLTFGIALALALLFFQVQTPLDSLARSNAQQALTAQRELYQGRIISSIGTLSDKLLGLTSQAPVVSFTSAVAGNPDADMRLAKANLTPFFGDQLTAAGSPFYRLRYLSVTGSNLVSVVGSANGNVTGHVENPTTLPNESGRPYFQALMALSQGKTYLLPPVVSTDGIPLIEIGTPLYSNNSAVGALVGSYPAKDFLSGLFNANANTTVGAVLQDGSGTILAASDPLQQSIFTLGQAGAQNYGIPSAVNGESESNMTEISGKLYLVSHLQNVSTLPTNSWILAVTESTEIAFRQSNTLKTSLLASLLALFGLGFIGAIFVSRSVSRPLAEVTRMAHSLAGTGAVRSPDAPVPTFQESREDEIGQLATALTTMNRRLTESFGSLESRVAERTRNLEIAAEIGRDAAQLRDIDELLQRAVNAIRDRFNFYHAQVFLLDDAGEYAVLVTSTGEAGKVLLGRNHKLAVGSNSVVGQTTGKGRTFITLDTQKSDVPHRFNPVLPKTRSEMAVPLRAGGRIIGALDVQSVEADAFDEDDAQIFEVLADQIAIAIDNARLLDESEGRVRQIADLNRQLTRSAWDEYLQGEKGTEIGYHYDLREIKPLATADPQTQANKPEVEEVDIKVRGQTVGSISVQPGEEQFTDEERSVLQAITERVALAIENARLVEQTQSALSRVEQLYQATRTLGKATDLSNVFEIVADQLHGFEAIDRMIILLAGPDPVPNAEYLEVSYVWERYLLPDSPYTLSRRYVSSLLTPLTSGNRRAYAMDVENDLSGYDMLRRELKTVGAESVSSALLTTANRWFGVLVCHSSRQHAFGDNFLQFLSAISDQVAAAIENQLLIRNIQTEAARSRALADAVQVSSQMGSEFETGIANLFRVVSGPAEFDRWWFGQMVTTDGLPMLVRVTSHFDDGSPLYLLARIRLQSDQNSIAEAARLGEWVLVNDPSDHHALAGISQQNVRAFGKHIAVPVLSGTQVVGALMVGRDLEKHDLDERDVQLAVALANQVAVVLENRRLFATAETERKTLQSVIDSLPTGIVVIDGKTHEITLTNSLGRSLLGLDEIVPYRRVHALTGSPYREDEFPPLRALETAAAISGEDMSVILPDGDRRELLVNAAPITSREGEVVSAVAVFQDVTELRELETELAESLRETTSMYETSRSISSESDLPGVLKVIGNQVRTNAAPSNMFAIFAKSEQPGIGQAFVADTTGEGGVEPIVGDLPIPESILMQNEAFIEDNIASNPSLANDPQLAALGIVSVASFPFNVRSHTVGWFVVGFDSPHELTMEQRRSITTLIDQASVAVENARLAEETAQALSETGLLYEASFNINRVSDIPQALEVIRDEIKFFAPTQIDVFLAQNEGETAAVEWAMHWNANDNFLGRGASGIPDVPNGEEGQTVPRMIRQVLPGDFSALLEAETQFVSDRNSASSEESSIFHALPGFEEFQAQASVPMVVAGRSTGRLIVSFNRPYNFGRLEQQFISALADQAAIVINNNMLVQQTRDSLEETGTLYETSRAIADSPNLSGIMHAIIDRACPSDVTRASLFRLLTDSWDAPDVTVELAASWEHNSFDEAANIRYVPQQYPAWDLISVSEVKWVEDVASDSFL